MRRSMLRCALLAPVEAGAVAEPVVTASAAVRPIHESAAAAADAAEAAVAMTGHAQQALEHTHAAVASAATNSGLTGAQKDHLRRAVHSLEKVAEAAGGGARSTAVQERIEALRAEVAGLRGAAADANEARGARVGRLRSELSRLRALEKELESRAHSRAEAAAEARQVDEMSDAVDAQAREAVVRARDQAKKEGAIKSEIDAVATAAAEAKTKKDADSVVERVESLEKQVQDSKAQLKSDMKEAAQKSPEEVAQERAARDRQVIAKAKEAGKVISTNAFDAATDKEQASAKKSAPSVENVDGVHIGSVPTPVHQEVSEGGINHDTQMPFGELEPFGREDTAKELTEASIKQTNAMVDQLEKAEVAEQRRSVFRALTRLRGAAITSFDAVARSHTGNADEYSLTHQWRVTHPLHHLAAEEGDVQKWAFPDSADF